MDLRLDKIPIPGRLPALMKEFCKCALKTQPADLLHWSCLYFKHCADSSFCVSVNHWQLPIVAESHLSPQLIQKLARTLTNESGYIPVQDLRNYWSGHRMNPIHLQSLLNIVSPNPYLYLSKTLFVTLASAHVSPNFRTTLYNICSTLYEDRLVPVAEFLDVYEYLALLDMGGTCVAESFKQDAESEGSWGPPLLPLSPDYCYTSFVPSLSSPSSTNIFTSSCNSETKLMVWKAFPLDYPTTSEARRVQSLGVTSRDGLAMWTEEPVCEGYVGVLEFVKKQIDPIEEYIQTHIEHSLGARLEDITGDQDNRRQKVHNKEFAFRQEIYSATLEDNRDAYYLEMQRRDDRQLKVIREHYDRLREVDERLQSLREVLERRTDADSSDAWALVLKQLLERLETHLGDVAECQEDKTKEEEPSEEKKNLLEEFRRHINPYIVDNVKNILNLVDCILGIPLGQDCTHTQPLQDAKEALSQVVNFILGCETCGTPSIEEPPPEPPGECRVKLGCSNKMDFTEVPNMEADSYDLSPQLALSSGSRYCVPGIGSRVGATAMAVARCYFVSVSSDQCGMVRVGNVIDVMCPPLQ